MSCLCGTDNENDPKHFYLGKKILSPAVKSYIRRKVGELHVSASDDEAVEYIFARMNKGAPQWFRDAAAKEARKVHRANRKLFGKVMGGLGGFKSPPLKFNARTGPRAGTKVKFDPNPASLPMYGANAPREGEHGVVTSVPFPGGKKKTYFAGPGGGLVYVKWSSGLVIGVSTHDITPL